MKRPLTWPYWLLGLFALVVAAEHALFAWLAPRYVLYLVRSATGGTVAIQHAQLTFPFLTALEGLHWVGNNDRAGLSIRRMTIWPRWISFRTREVWLSAVTLEDALLRITRQPGGTLITPSLAFSPPGGIAPGLPRPSAPWVVHVDTVKVERGVLELMDTKLHRPFHGAIQHASFVMGPLTLPRADAQTTFALRAQVSGDAGHAAPVYCSGWFNALAKDLQASCRLEPLALAALDPYYPSGKVKVRVYDATVSSTSQWQARQNALAGDIQLKMANLTEGDLSVMGRTILDVPAVTGGQEVSGAVSLTGPLDNPALWEAHFLPGDERVELLLAPLLEHGIQFVKVPFVGRGVRITAPSTDQAADEIQEASERIEKELEILVPIAPVEASLAVPEPAITEPGTAAPEAILMEPVVPEPPATAPDAAGGGAVSIAPSAPAAAPAPVPEPAATPTGKVAAPGPSP